jgi:signal transduction histidine kinase
MLITMHLLEKARATGNSYRALLLIVVLQCWSASALASPHVGVRIDENTDGLDFHGSVMIFIDSLGIYGTPSGPGWPPASAYTKSFSPGKYKGGDIWCRFHLQNESLEDRAFIVEPGGFREVYVFYRPEGSEGYSVKQTGNHVPYPRNEMGDLGFMTNKVKVSLAAGIGYEFLVWYPDPGFDKIEPSFVVSDAEKWETSWRSARERSLIFFLPFLGICLVLSVISFAYYLVHQQNSYTLYVTYILSSLLFSAIVTRVLEFSLLIEHPQYYHFARDLSLILLVISYLFFIRSFLDLQARFPMLSKTLIGLSIYLMVGLTVTSWMKIKMQIPVIANTVIDYFLLGNILVGALIVAQLFRTRNKLDTILISGAAVLVVESIINILVDIEGNHKHLIPPIHQIATVIELIIFSLGLSVKLRLNIQEKQAARLRLIDQLKENEGLQRSISHKLEAQVQERTAEIQTQNEELITQQEELEAQRDMLEDQNKVIADSMEELEQIRAELEKTVERRTLELKNANLELLQRNDQLEQYAYITAHNLRGPVARLKGLIFLFDKLEGTNKENRDVFGKIARSAHEMDDVLTDMNAILEVKTNAQGRTAFVKIRTALENAREVLQDKIIDARPQIEVELRVEEVYGNPAYMEGIFENLLDNSMKYRSAKRELQIGIISRKDKGQVVIEVKDNGIGIDMKRSAGKIFRLYQRFHEHGEGKGLGLYLVKTQVEAMGGSISIESEVDVGTTLQISLPE